MRIARVTKRFRRDYAKTKRSGKNMTKLHTAMELLMGAGVLPIKYRDHALKGEWQHLRDCHIEGNWLLLYEIDDDTKGDGIITFHATGTHDHLFG